jgi:hypothetical protein
MRYHRDVSAGCWCGVEVEVEVCCLGILKHSRRSRILTLCADHSSLCSHLHILLPDARYSISYSRSNALLFNTTKGLSSCKLTWLPTHAAKGRRAGLNVCKRPACVFEKMNRTDTVASRTMHDSPLVKVKRARTRRLYVSCVGACAVVRCL